MTACATATPVKSSTRDSALTCLVAYFALNKTEDLPCAIKTAKEQGIAQEQIDRIRDYVKSLTQAAAKAEPAVEPSLSDLLVKATKSSCCS